jgi:hypothetical protein
MKLKVPLIEAYYMNLTLDIERFSFLVANNFKIKANSENDFTWDFNNELIKL